MQFFKTIRPSHLGLLTIHMWIYCVTHRDAPTGDVSIMTVMYLILSAFLIGLFMVVRKKPLPEKVKRGGDAIGILFTAAAALLLALPLPFSGTVTGFIGSAIGGIGAGWAYMRWGEFYSKLDIRYSTPLIFLTMAVGSFGKTIVDLLPPVPATIVLMCLPVVTYLCLYRAFKTEPESVEPFRYYNNRTIKSLWRLGLGIAIYSLVTGIIQSTPFEAVPSPYYLFILAKHGGEIVLSLALFLWVVAFKRGFSFSRTWRLVLLLMATALIFAPLLEEVVGSYLYAFIGIAQTFLIILLFLALADIARHSTYNSMAVFSIGWLAYTLPFCLGDILGYALQDSVPNATVITSAIVWVLVVATMFFLDESSVGNHLIFTELTHGREDEDTPMQRVEAVQQSLNDQDAAEAADMITLRCEALAQELRLTPREFEVLELLARGRSKAYIADAFFISENTVRGHVKRLYAKLDVHNRQELVDRVESTAVHS